MGKLKKLFGGISLTWPKLIIMAVIAGVYTAVVAIIPALHYTSLHTIAVTFEVWVFFGIFIIMNSKSNKDSALKCFVFFLISQPLVYLIQVPFSSLGWGLFGYYKFWLIWTVLCLPMGFIGYYMKKDKWWGYLILLPMLFLTGYSYLEYFSSMQFYFPFYLLIVLFCAAAMVLYPLVIFNDKRIRAVGAAISGAAIVALTILCLLKPPVYSANLLSSGDELTFDDKSSVSLEDGKYGDVSILYLEDIEDYVLHADFKKAGTTVLTVESPNGEKTEYDLTIQKDTYEMTRR